MMASRSFTAQQDAWLERGTTERSGIATSYEGFVVAYDDLWFPSSDDVWVLPLSGGWLLEIDHEEVLRLYALPPSALLDGT